MILEIISLCGELIKLHRFVVILKTTCWCGELVKSYDVKVCYDPQNNKFVW